MKKNYVKHRLFAGALSLMIFLTGCSEIKSDSPGEGKYATQNKETALEYSIYMNKQIQIFVNEISSRMAVAKNITGNKTADNEAALADSAVETMQKAYDEAYTVNPSNGADDKRDSTLTAMQTAIDHMKGYSEAVKKGESVEGYITDFQNDFNQLTGLAGLYN